jgi:hypothetical protein
VPVDRAVDWLGEGKVKEEVLKCFPFCPFCLGRYVFGKRDEFWRAICLAAKNSPPPPAAPAAPVVTVKEIINQKEVIVKIRCKYCKHTFLETLDKCPNCGAMV